MLLATILSTLMSVSLALSNVDKVTTANNGATIKIYKQLKGTNDNVICSPFSLADVLCLLSAGAGGATGNEIRKALGFSPGDQPAINEGFKELLPKLTGNDQYDLSVANSVWVKKDIVIVPDYKTIATQDYYSEVNPLDGADPAKKINDWVSNKTKQKITKLFDTLDSSALVVLVNAIYFKGSWKTEFPIKDTMNGLFFTPTGNKTTPLMKVEAKFNYTSSSSTLKAKVIELPYVGDAVSMYVVLPDDVNGLASIEGSLTSDQITKVISSMTERKVAVTFPKFKIESEFDLNASLMKLGIKTAFTSAADFSGITTTPLQISKSVQKAIIEVDEKGTVAAAATGVVTTLAMELPEVFEADKPFLFFIYDKPAKTLLFFGKYTQPSS